ncbi:MAG: hypothetical protein V5A88_05025 [Candidatus Thermoplasmatota archaeon]
MIGKYINEYKKHKIGWITVTIYEDKDITAHFKEINYYDLTITVEGEETVDIVPEQDEYESGMEVNITAVAEEDWEFVGWTGVDETDEQITITINEDMDLTARIEEEK